MMQPWWNFFSYAETLALLQDGEKGLTLAFSNSFYLSSHHFGVPLIWVQLIAGVKRIRKSHPHIKIQVNWLEVCFSVVGELRAIFFTYKLPKVNAITR